MTNSMKTENKLEGASNYTAWKKRIDLILEKNKCLDLVQEKVKKLTDESSNATKVKFGELEIMAKNLIVDGVKDNLIPYISNINSAQQMYKPLSKLFTINNIGQIANLKNELRVVKMTNDDTVSLYFIRISRIRDELQEIDEVVPKKELVITALLGLPRSWSAFTSGLNNWKDMPTCEQMWNACSQEEARISMVNNKKENEEENTLNAYSAHHKKKGTFKKFKEPKKKRNLFKAECYNFHKMGHYQSNFPKNP